MFNDRQSKTSEFHYLIAPRHRVASHESRIFSSIAMRTSNLATNSYLNLLNYVTFINLLKPTDHVMQQQFNIQQLYVLPTLYLCVLYLSENKQRLVPLTA